MTEPISLAEQLAEAQALFRAGAYHIDHEQAFRRTQVLEAIVATLTRLVEQSQAADGHVLRVEHDIQTTQDGRRYCWDCEQWID